MSHTKLAARALLAGVTLAALGLFVAAPASAHTNNLYTFVNGDEDEGWGTLDRTNGNATLLPTPPSNGDNIQGAEVTGEVGYAILNGEVPQGFTWDHSTGAESTPVPLFVDGSFGIIGIVGLDTRLDGTLLTFVAFATGPETFDLAVATVDFATGELVPVVLLSDFFEEREEWTVQSLATDPLSGITYAFIQDGTDSYYLPLDVPLGTFGEAVQFAEFIPGLVQGADFDGDGTLFFNFRNEERFATELSHIGVVSTWAGATREVIGDAAGNFGANALESFALTLEFIPPALAATGTGMPMALLLAGGVAVVAGGIVVVTTRRRTGAAV